MTIVLNGFTASNYHNKVKLALLEKNIPFEERIVFPYDDPEFQTVSPVGKIPYLEIGGGTRLYESQAIVDYLEETHTAVPLYPADPLERGRIRSLIQIMELYLEWVARRLYGPAVFGLPVPPGQKEEAAEDLKFAVAALARVVRFDPYIGGKSFTLADVAAVWHFATVRDTMQTIYGHNVLAELAGLDDYLAMMYERPHVAACEQARKAGMEPFIAAVKRRYRLGDA